MSEPVMAFSNVLMTGSLALYAGLLFGGLAGSLVPRLAALDPATSPLKTLRALSYPGSHCSCGRELSIIDILPVIGWAKSLGRCPSCERKIPAAYPLMEATISLFFVALAGGSLRLPVATFGITILPAIISLYLAALLYRLRPRGATFFTLLAAGILIVASGFSALPLGLAGGVLLLGFLSDRRLFSKKVLLAGAIVLAAGMLPGGLISAWIAFLGVLCVDHLYRLFDVVDPERSGSETTAVVV